MKINNLTRTGFMLGTGLMMGLMFSFQSKSLEQANQFYNRESRLSIFKEIQIVKKSNQVLNEQIQDLQKQIAESTDRKSVLENINKDLKRYKIATGELGIEGEGIRIVVSGEIEALWFTDLINELNSAGAESLSVNGIRLSSQNRGFDTMPNGQILLAGEILTAPFTFEAIGDAAGLESALLQSGGIMERLKGYKPKYQIDLKQISKIKMEPQKSEA